MSRGDWRLGVTTAIPWGLEKTNSSKLSLLAHGKTRGHPRAVAVNHHRAPPAACARTGRRWGHAPAATPALSSLPSSHGANGAAGRWVSAPPAWMLPRRGCCSAWPQPSPGPRPCGHAPTGGQKWGGEWGVPGCGMRQEVCVGHGDTERARPATGFGTRHEEQVAVPAWGRGRQRCQDPHGQGYHSRVFAELVA